MDDLELVNNMKKRIKDLKKRKDITTEQLSLLSNIPIGTLSKILGKETKDPQINSIIKIAKALNVTTDYLVYGLGEIAPVKDSLTTELNESQQKLLDNYNQLNEIGKERLIETSEEMKELEKYKKDDTLSNLA